MYNRLIIDQKVIIPGGMYDYYLQGEMFGEYFGPFYFLAPYKT